MKVKSKERLRTTKEELQKIFGLVPIICEQQGITLAELQKKTAFGKEAELLAALDRLIMFGVPPFSPADFISVHVDSEQRVYLDFPLGLEKPLALTAEEWTAVQKLVREELDYIPLGKESIEALRGLLGQISTVPALFEDNERYSYQRSIIQEALEDKLQLEFSYQSLSSREAEIRRVEPWLLFNHKARSYLIAYCYTRAQPRCFLLERMQLPEILDLKQKHPPPADITAYLKQSPFFQAPEAGISVRIAFSPTLLSYLKRNLYIKETKDYSGAQALASNWLEASAKVKDSIWLRSFLRGLGPEVVLLEPAHLRESFRKELEAIAIAPCMKKET